VTGVTVVAAVHVRHIVTGVRVGRLFVIIVAHVSILKPKRQEANQNLRFAPRPFVLWGLAIKKLATGQFSLQVTSLPSYGLPGWDKTGLFRIAMQQGVVKSGNHGHDLIGVVAMRHLPPKATTAIH
jgi:hypothetical protein